MKNSLVFSSPLIRYKIYPLRCGKTVIYLYPEKAILCQLLLQQLYQDIK